VKRLRRLDVRLFGSYALVAIVVLAALILTFALRAPSLFTNRIRNAGEGGSTETESNRAFVGALWSTLPIALAVSVAAAALVTAFVARQILRPIAAVRRATGRLAAGRYDERVAEPAALELAALAGDVNRLADTLQHTEARRARLIGEVAHEMRTPLTAITGYVEGMLDGVFEPTEEILANVGEEAARLQRLATDLATLSRAEEGALELRVDDADLHELAASATTRLRPQYDEKGVALELADGPMLSVQVDRDRIIQVLTNLLGNALTYTAPGGSVIVRTHEHQGVASVTISDDGVGIAAEDLPLVFERFFRVPGLDRPPGGSGIGLTVAAGIARAHHGVIRASSRGLGAGATFTLELPAGTHPR
jgi:signal transduction histidine kinase